MLLKGSKAMETAECEIGTVRRMVHNPPGVASQPVTSSVGMMWGTVISISLDPFRSTWLANDLQQKPTQSTAVTYWLQKLHFDFFYTGIHALVSRWAKCLSVSDDYVVV
jgi:hypothetical protein